VTDHFTARALDGLIAGVAADPGGGAPLLLLHGGPGISDTMDMWCSAIPGAATLRCNWRSHTRIGWQPW
jgi:hypothetical protein